MWSMTSMFIKTLFFRQFFNYYEWCQCRCTPVHENQSKTDKGAFNYQFYGFFMSLSITTNFVGKKMFGLVIVKSADDENQLRLARQF